MARAKIRFSKYFGWWDVYVLDEKQNCYNLVLRHIGENDIKDLKKTFEENGTKYEEVKGIL